MILLLDTNVLSELVRPVPEPRVVRWMARQDRAMLHTSTVTLAEILSGLAMMPQGRRRAALEQAVMDIFAKDLAGRVLSFGQRAAVAYADISAARRQAGLGFTGMDLMIAAIARAHDAAVVTRDAVGFAACGVARIDPWMD